MLGLIRQAVEWLASERAERRLLVTDRLRAVLAEKDAINAHSRLSSGEYVGDGREARAAGQRIEHA